ncbi:uncharacterized protein [Physcomitrium patens]|uniref:Response regulatory domain-containing protein n=1 Tax=Physcomitrium patens TaxID=3218 RepID=A0A2K1II94_PHYPA|nr:two-component response regulator ARR7-like [Physcomitrium patens]XP_024362004.1 two-component response regulator ARR7-like [Physcomitrium patens]PNR28999.1 hypothetical protein PHYPA_027691 [Physcomitrium patens]|eukprot:XP_024362003.1 two-component response regulator ARR7-like [Physcomitrella patens]
MEALVQSVSNFEGKMESGMLSSYHDLPWKVLLPKERAKVQSKWKAKSRKVRDQGKQMSAGVGSAKTCESSTHTVGTGNQKVEPNSHDLPPVENSDSDQSRAEDPRSEETSAESVLSMSNPEYHVLAVDDSIIDRKVIERLLKTSSYKVTTVNSALRALEYLGLSESCSTSVKANKVTVNLIMTDYCMPEMTGYDLLKIVKAETSAFKELPVIVMSSENDSNRIKRCLEEGAKEFLIKPVQIEDVQRLHGHIRLASASSGSSDSSNTSTCAKRKAPDGLQPNSPVRRPRYEGVAVA